MYSERVLDHFQRPRHAGELADGPGQCLEVEAGSMADAAIVAFRLRIDGGCIASLAFRAWGCPHVLAACSIASEWLHGAPVARLAEITAADLATAVDAPRAKLGRMLVIEDALRKGWRAWDNKQLCAPSTGRDQAWRSS